MGYYLDHMAVEFYKGSWILRARLPVDAPVEVSREATHAMRQWMRRNAARYQGNVNG